MENGTYLQRTCSGGTSLPNYPVQVGHYHKAAVSLLNFGNSKFRTHRIPQFLLMVYQLAIIIHGRTCI